MFSRTTESNPPWSVWAKREPAPGPFGVNEPFDVIHPTDKPQHIHIDHGLVSIPMYNGFEQKNVWKRCDNSLSNPKCWKNTLMGPQRFAETLYQKVKYDNNNFDWDKLRPASRIEHWITHAQCDDDLGDPPKLVYSAIPPYREDELFLESQYAYTDYLCGNTNYFQQPTRKGLQVEVRGQATELAKVFPEVADDILVARRTSIINSLFNGRSKLTYDSFIFNCHEVIVNDNGKHSVEQKTRLIQKVFETAEVLVEPLAEKLVKAELGTQYGKWPGTTRHLTDQIGEELIYELNNKIFSPSGAMTIDVMNVSDIDARLKYTRITGIDYVMDLLARSAKVGFKLVPNSFLMAFELADFALRVASGEPTSYISKQGALDFSDSINPRFVMCTPFVVAMSTIYEITRNVIVPIGVGAVTALSMPTAALAVVGGTIATGLALLLNGFVSVISHSARFGLNSFRLDMYETVRAELERMLTVTDRDIMNRYGKDGVFWREYRLAKETESSESSEKKISAERRDGNGNRLQFILD